jgi:hypothetical protein
MATAAPREQKPCQSCSNERRSRQETGINRWWWRSPPWIGPHLLPSVRVQYLPLHGQQVESRGTESSRRCDQRSSTLQLQSLWSSGQPLSLVSCILAMAMWLTCLA